MYLRMEPKAHGDFQRVMTIQVLDGLIPGHMGIFEWNVSSNGTECLWNRSRELLRHTWVSSNGMYLRMEPKAHGHDLDEASRHLPAFWTHGYLRMEPSAHENFKRVMMTQVLDGLIHAICELYIDDCFVFGSTGNEYLTRLE